MKKISRTLALILAVVLMLTALAGCKDKTTASESGSGTNGESGSSGFTYLAEYSTVQNDQFQYPNYSAYYDGKIYACGSYITGTETSVDSSTGEEYEYNVYDTGIFVMNEDGSDAKLLENYKTDAIPEGYEGSTGINGMFIDAEGNIWVAEDMYTYYFDLPDDFDESSDDKWNYYQGGEESYTVRKLDSTGAEISRVDLTELQTQVEEESGYFYINSVQIDNDSNIYIAVDTKIYVLSVEGDILFSVGQDDWIQQIIRLPDGSIAVYYSSYDEEQEKTVNQFVPIDVEAQDWGEAVPAPYDSYSFYTGGGDYDIYYQSGISFYGYKFDTQEATKLFSWIDIDVDNSNLTSIMPLDDGRIICLSRDYNVDPVLNEVVVLNKVDSATVPQKTILTLACMYLDYNLRSEIIKFNRTNDTYRIEVKDYSEYNTDDDTSAGLTKLTTEIIAGDVPDILCTDSLPIDRYAAKGILEDLWPFIESDTELGGRDGVVEPFFNALEVDGKLYEIGACFYLRTVAGPSSLVGTDAGWTIDEALAAISQMPEEATIFDPYVTRDDILRMYCYMMMDEFINWETGECSFDSPEFVAALEFANMFPEDYDWENNDDYESDIQKIRTGRQMLYVATISDFNTVQLINKIFDDQATFVGYPTGTGEGNGSAFYMDTTLAMSSTCQNKEGAWEFIRILLTEDYQEENSWWFPTNKTMFDKKLEEAMTPEYRTDPETGEQVELSKSTWWVTDDETLEVYHMTEADRDMLMDIINNTTHVMNYDSDIYEVISEDAEAYFAGQKTAEEVAKLIQSRMNIYVNEQR